MTDPEEERNQSEIALACRDCRRFLEPLEAHLDGREFLVGVEPTVADCNAAYTLDWATRKINSTPRPTAELWWNGCTPARGAGADREGFAYLNAGETARGSPRYRTERPPMIENTSE